MVQPLPKKATEKPYYGLDGNKIRCEKCGRLAKWVDSAETDTGYLCPNCMENEVD